VPFIVNRVMKDLPNEPVLRNFDAFYYAVMAAAQVAN
jgi:phosphonoacetate hydrolase